MPKLTRTEFKKAFARECDLSVCDEDLNVIYSLAEQTERNLHDLTNLKRTPKQHAGSRFALLAEITFIHDHWDDFLRRMYNETRSYPKEANGVSAGLNAVSDLIRRSLESSLARLDPSKPATPPKRVPIYERKNGPAHIVPQRQPPNTVEQRKQELIQQYRVNWESFRLPGKGRYGAQQIESEFMLGVFDVIVNSPESSVQHVTRKRQVEAVVVCLKLLLNLHMTVKAVDSRLRTLSSQT